MRCADRGGRAGHVAALGGWPQPPRQDAPPSLPAIEPRGADRLPPALLDSPEADSPVRPTLPARRGPPAGGRSDWPTHWRESLRNVETVQANLAVRTATVAQFEALKAFVPLINMPQTQVGFSRVTGPVNGQNVHLPRHHRRHAARGPARARPRHGQPVQYVPAAGSLRAHHRLADRRGRHPRQGTDGTARPPLAGRAGGPALFRGQADRLRPARADAGTYVARGDPRARPTQAPRAAGARRRGQPGPGRSRAGQGPVRRPREGRANHRATARHRGAPVPAYWCPPS